MATISIPTAERAKVTHDFLNIILNRNMWKWFFCLLLSGCHASVRWKHSPSVFNLLKEGPLQPRSWPHTMKTICHANVSPYSSREVLQLAIGPPSPTNLCNVSKSTYACIKCTIISFIALKPIHTERKRKWKRKLFSNVWIFLWSPSLALWFVLLPHSLSLNVNGPLQFYNSLL